MSQFVHFIINGSDFLADLATIIASGIAIYIFCTKRKHIGAAIKLLLSYSFQLTMSELRSKLDRLNEINANEESQRDEIKAIMSDIAGQLRGNRALQQKCRNLIEKLENYSEEDNEKLTEPRKRSVVSELREKLR